MKYSSNISAVRQRIRRLPKIAIDIIQTSRKKDAQKCIGYWKSGLLNDEFKLTPLAPSTIKKKIKLGYSKPTNPLYGLGMDGAHTYIKGLRMFRTKNGYVIRMVGKHHDSKIDNHGLLMIHEYGCTTKHGRIPARPALNLAYRKTINELKKRDVMIVDAINELLKTGNDSLLQEIKSRL